MSGKRLNSSSKRYAKDERKISKTRIIIALIIILVIIGVVILTINKTNIQDNLKQEVETVLSEVFNGLKNCDENKVNQYLDYKLLISSFDSMIVEKENEISTNILKKMFEKIEWTIEDIDIKEDGAVGIVEVTNINFKTVVTNWMKEIVSINSTGIVVTNDLALEKLLNILEQQDLETKTIIKKVKLIKQDNKWDVEFNEDFRDLVYPGLDSVITVLNESEAE